MELVKIEKGKIIVAEEIIKGIAEFEKQALEMKLKQDELKKSLLEAMEENEITNWESPNKEITVSYRKPSTRTTLDSKKLKEDMPDIFEEYSKTSNVKSSITLKINC